jgi:hypothetical protein
MCNGELKVCCIAIALCSSVIERGCNQSANKSQSSEIEPIIIVMSNSHLNQGGALSPIFFNFTLEYAIRKVQENQMGLKLNGTHQMLVYVDDVNLLRDNVDTIKKNKESLIEASKDIGLEVNQRKLSICCCFISRMLGNVMT